MFVFIVIFSYFQVPKAYQHQVLFYGILGAMIFRGIFIAAGVALIEQFEWIIYIFGAFLIFTAFRIVRETEEIHPEDNPIIKFFTKRFPSTHEFDGQKLFTIQNGKRLATPLFVTSVVHRDHRHRVRPRFDPGHLRHHGRPVHHPDLERVRDPRAACPLLPARRKHG